MTLRSPILHFCCSKQLGSVERMIEPKPLRAGIGCPHTLPELSKLRGEFVR